MSTHNIDFYEEISKLSLNYHEISPNMHLISSSDNLVFSNGGKIEFCCKVANKLPVY